MQNLAKTALHCVAAFALAALPLFAAAATPGDYFKAQTQAWGDAYNTGAPENAGKIVAMYADDGVMMPPDAPAAAGHDAMTAFITKDMAGTHAAGLSLRMEAGDTAGSCDDMGWHSGTYSVVGKDGKAVATGKFVEVWKKTDGKWLMIRDIWNNDAAAAAMPAAPETAKQ